MKRLFKLNIHYISSIPALKLYRILRKLKNILIQKKLENSKTSEHKSEILDVEFKNQPLKNIFESIYFNNLWIGKSSGLFYSGSGSHNEKCIIPYIQSVNKFLSEFDKPVTFIDLGCGDFNVGKLIKGNIKNYIACDIVPLVITYNQKTIKKMKVDFVLPQREKDKRSKNKV